MKLITITALAGLLGPALPLGLSPQDAKPDFPPPPFVLDPAPPMSPVATRAVIDAALAPGEVAA